MTFGEKIQKLRKEAGLSQEELAYQLGVSRQAISKWERDSGYPETEKIVRMSKLFHVSLDYLLDEEDTKKSMKKIRRSRRTVRTKKASMSVGKWQTDFWLTKKAK